MRYRLACTAMSSACAQPRTCGGGRQAASHAGVRERWCRKSNSCTSGAQDTTLAHNSTLHARACLTQPRGLPADLHRVHGRAAAQLHGRTRHAGWLQSTSRCHWCHLVWVVQLCSHVRHACSAALASARAHKARREAWRWKACTVNGNRSKMEDSLRCLPSLSARTHRRIGARLPLRGAP